MGTWKLFFTPVTGRRAVIVDAVQQHCLIAHHDAAFLQGVQGPLGLRAQFARVVELGDQTEMFLRAVFLEQVQQLLIHVNPHGQNHRRAAANPDDIQMLHAAQLLQVFMEHGRGVEQGVAAGKQNIADLVMLADIRQDLVAPRLRFPAFQTHQALAEAMAAVHGAGIGGENQRRLSVLVLQACQHRI